MTSGSPGVGLADGCILVDWRLRATSRWPCSLSPNAIGFTLIVKGQSRIFLRAFEQQLLDINKCAFGFIVHAWGGWSRCCSRSQEDTFGQRRLLCGSGALCSFLCPVPSCPHPREPMMTSANAPIWAVPWQPNVTNRRVLVYCVLLILPLTCSQISSIPVSAGNPVSWLESVEHSVN